MRGGAYKVIVSETGKFTLFQKDYSLDTLGERGLTVHSVEIWAKIPKGTPA